MGQLVTHLFINWLAVSSFWLKECLASPFLSHTHTFALLKLQNHLRILGLVYVLYIIIEIVGLWNVFLATAIVFQF